MTRLKGCLFVAALVAPLFAGSKEPPAAKGSNGKLTMEARLYLDRAAVTEVVGAELDKGVVAVELTLTPRNGEKIQVSRDDFLLRSFKDGQKSGAFHPSQLAGNSVLRVSSRPGQGGDIAMEDRGPVWGGIGGPPRRIPGQSPGIGNTAVQEEAVAAVDDRESERENPTLAILKKKVLPEGEFDKPVSGQLYFLLEGKHKPKDITLDYKGPAGKISLEFSDK
jgi:hypothetical protein